MIWKPWTIDQRQKFMEQLLQTTGHSLYAEACARTEDKEQAAEIWVITLQTLFDMTTSRRRTEALTWDALLLVLQRVVSRHQITEDPISSVDTVPDVEFTDALNGRGRKVIRAHAAMLNAVRHHQIPRWTRAAIGLMCMFGVAATLYGSRGEWQTLTQGHTSLPQEASAALPTPYGNLPVTPVGRYRLGHLSMTEFNHLSVAGTHLYASRLDSGRTWPRLVVQKIPLTTEGDNFATVPSSVTHILELVVPTQKSKVKWNVGAWRVEVTGNWAIATVHWQAKGASPVEQIYAMTLVTGASSLVQTLTADSQMANEYVVAVGNDKVIVQSALSQSANEPPVSLPISVYELSGRDPLHALSLTRQLPASFGLMVNPTVQSDGILFQGTDGATPNEFAATGAWNLLNWGGSLTKLYGPPVDGQPHYAVKGVSGGLWWAETTPSTQNPNRLQVSMGPLTQVARQTMPNLVQNGIVSYFSVSSNDFLWVQGEGNTTELVVAQVQ